MKFNAGKRGTIFQQEELMQTALKLEWLGSAAGESLGTAGDHEQTVNQQCHIAAKTQTILIWGRSR